MTSRLQPPILLFQGAADTKVPAATSDQLARLAGDVTYVRVAGADHLDSWNLDPAGYDRAVQAFVDRVLGTSRRGLTPGAAGVQPATPSLPFVWSLSYRAVGAGQSDPSNRE